MCCPSRPPGSCWPGSPASSDRGAAGRGRGGVRATGRVALAVALARSGDRPWRQLVANARRASSSAARERSSRTPTRTRSKRCRSPSARSRDTDAERLSQSRRLPARHYGPGHSDRPLLGLTCGDHDRCADTTAAAERLQTASCSRSTGEGITFHDLQRDFLLCRRTTLARCTSTCSPRTAPSCRHEASMGAAAAGRALHLGAPALPPPRRRRRHRDHRTGVRPRLPCRALLSQRPLRRRVRPAPSR